MASVAQWIEGARPYTFPNALTPVVAGTGAAAALGSEVWWKAMLALTVSLALLVGVNFANDYSDGVRGTDEERVGPLRLVGSGLAAPASVKFAAMNCFALAAAVGVTLALVSAWWMVLVGALCILGSWYYTGGKKPYGYNGFGEIAVFVFFGLIAVLGTEFVQSGRVDVVGLLMAVAIGSFSSAVLMVNNLRDIRTDSESGKDTLAVKLGDARARTLHLALLVVPFLVIFALAGHTIWALTGLLAFPLAVKANEPVRNGELGANLGPALTTTGQAMLVWATAVGLALSLS